LEWSFSYHLLLPYKGLSCWRPHNKLLVCQLGWSVLLLQLLQAQSDSSQCHLTSLFKWIFKCKLFNIGISFVRLGACMVEILIKMIRIGTWNTVLKLQPLLSVRRFYDQVIWKLFVKISILAYETRKCKIQGLILNQPHFYKFFSCTFKS